MDELKAMRGNQRQIFCNKIGGGDCMGRPIRMTANDWLAGWLDGYLSHIRLRLYVNLPRDLHQEPRVKVVQTTNPVSMPLYISSYHPE